MPKVLTYACDGGGQFQEHQFDYFSMNAEDVPNFCPKCGIQFGDTPEQIPTTFMIPTAKGRQTDITYREIEAASLVRAEKAKEMGATDAEANAIKVTNLKDNLREGDVAGIPQKVSNVVTQTAEQMASMYGKTEPYFQGGLGGVAGGTGAKVQQNAGLGAIQRKFVSSPQAPGNPMVKGRWGNG